MPLIIMSVNSAILFSLGICALSALLEGLCAGSGGKQYMARLRLPSYSAPLWGWYVIGVLYYVVCFVILYRIFRDQSAGTIRNVALVLILVMMGVNALWNYIFFRARNLYLSFIIFIPYNAIAIALFVCLLLFDRVAAFVLSPYLVYLVYANLWGYGLWRLNAKPAVAPEPGSWL
ncbi:MAG TPA: tryptophan-rich sensory protein [Pyrinomonadaceae bacterium]